MQPSQSNQGRITEEDSVQQPSTSAEASTCQASSTAVPLRVASLQKGASKVFGDDNISEEAMSVAGRGMQQNLPETPRRAVMLLMQQDCRFNTLQGKGASNLSPDRG